MVLFESSLIIIFWILFIIFIFIDDSNTTPINKAENIYKIRDIDESQEDRSQKVNYYQIITNFKIY